MHERIITICSDKNYWNYCKYLVANIRDIGMEKSTIVHFCHNDAPWHNNDYSNVLGMRYLDYYKKMVNNL